MAIVLWGSLLFGHILPTVALRLQHQNAWKPLDGKVAQFGRVAQVGEDWDETLDAWHVPGRVAPETIELSKSGKQLTGWAAHRCAKAIATNYTGLEESIFMITPAWLEELQRSDMEFDYQSVGFFLQEHLKQHPLRTLNISKASSIYVNVFSPTSPMFTEDTMKQNLEWLNQGIAVIPVQDDVGDKTPPQSLNFTEQLEEGRVTMAAYGPNACIKARKFPQAHLIYQDRYAFAGYTTCNEKLGIMAPAYSNNVQNLGVNGNLEWDHMELRKYTVFFNGNIPKPYISPPHCQVRFQLLRHLLKYPPAGDNLISGTNVESTVTPYTVKDEADRCGRCSYSCKRCYLESEIGSNWTNGKYMSPEYWAQSMAASTFCIVAFGDDDGTPKLAESVLFGCIPIIITSDKGMTLPFDKYIDYDKFSFHFNTFQVLEDPSIVNQAISNTTVEKQGAMRMAMQEIRGMFQYGCGSGAEEALLRQLIDTTANLSLPSGN